MILVDKLVNMKSYLPAGKSWTGLFELTVSLLFQLKPGAEGTGIGEAKSDFPGDGKFELPMKQGDTVVIISEKKGCPQGKWLVKNSEGHCMLSSCVFCW